MESIIKILFLILFIYVSFINILYGVILLGIFISYKEYEKYTSSVKEARYGQEDNANGRKNVIPLHIYQTWHTKDYSSPNMRKCVETLQTQNPEFVHHLFDDDDCRDFIADNFDEDVKHAYDSLAPGAYKADLWRYCVLYKNGGVYMDIKYKCADGVKLIDYVDKEYYVEDRPQGENRGVYNGVMICVKGDPKLLKAINSIVGNVKRKYYGETALSPTGPGLLGKTFTDEEFRNISLQFIGNTEDWNRKQIDKIIDKTNDKVIFVSYPEYRQDQLIIKDTYPHYGELWHKKQIYR